VSFFDTCRQASLVTPAAILILILGFAWQAQAQPGIPCFSCAGSCTDEFPSQPGCRGAECGAARAACIARCERTCAKPAPPVTINPRYLILSLLYSPPGCTNSSADKCNPQGSVAYADNSSTGTKVSTGSSFQEASKVSVGIKDLWNASAGFQITASDSTTETVTKTRGLTLGTQGTSDGVDHNQDQFVLFTDPVVIVGQTASSTLWSLAASGGSFNSLPITVADLKNPSKSAAGKQLIALGFTNTDFQTILAQDPFASDRATVNPLPAVEARVAAVRTPVIAGRLPVAGGGTPVNPDQFPNRYVFTGLQLGYVPPDAGACTNGACPCVTSQYTISNTTLDAGDTSFQTQYSVSLSIGGLGKLPDIGLESDSSFTWTNTATQENTTQNGQTATLTLACPSPTYTGPVEVDVYLDAVYGTFLFFPVVDTDLIVLHQGTITNGAGKPVAGEGVTLAFDGKTYRTFTDYRGRYRFTAPKAKAVPNQGQINIKGVLHTVGLRSPARAEFRIP